MHWWRIRDVGWLQAQSGKLGDCYLMRWETTVKICHLQSRMGNFQEQNRSNAVGKDRMVQGATLLVRSIWTTLKTQSLTKSALHSVTDILKRTTKDRQGRKTITPAAADGGGRRLARACPLGKKLEQQPDTTVRSPLLSQWLRGSQTSVNCTIGNSEQVSWDYLLEPGWQNTSRLQGEKKLYQNHSVQ